MNSRFGQPCESSSSIHIPAQGLFFEEVTPENLDIGRANQVQLIFDGRVPKALFSTSTNLVPWMAEELVSTEVLKRILFVLVAQMEILVETIMSIVVWDPQGACLRLAAGKA